MISRFLCRAATTFTKTGALDEDALRGHLTRLADANIGVVLASTGSGEGGTLSESEIETVYRIGVEVCKGKVSVLSNQPEEFTAEASIEQAKRAMSCNVDALNIYGPNGLHGYKATEREYFSYFERIFSEIDYPITLCPNPVIGYDPLPETIAELANENKQVIGIVLSGRMYDNSYFLRLLDLVDRDILIHTNTPGSMNTLALGAGGVEAPYPNLIPGTCSAYVSAFDAGDLAGSAKYYSDIRKFSAFVNRWSSPTPRWIKAGMKALHLPGGDGSVREPFLMYEEADQQKFKEELLSLQIPEIAEMADAIR